MPDPKKALDRVVKAMNDLSKPLKESPPEEEKKGEQTSSGKTPETTKAK